MSSRRTAGNRVDRPGRGWNFLRSSYFSQAADVAGRYGVTFDDVVAHLWMVRRTEGRVALRRINYMDDLVHKRDSGELDDYVRLKMKECEG